ncbi:PAS domain S-box protein [Halorientalis salina]|uniref:PAS domain S-box protein n=1 Tax=Halorientalis salina TaxID=2932266 RepID=UPI0010ABF8EB|nr:PAS domain S-box protein [Halorientalis salina]
MERSGPRWLVSKAFRERLAVKLAVSLVVSALVLGAFGIGATLLIREDVSGTVTEKYTSIATQESQTLELWHENNQAFLQAASATQDVQSDDRATVRAFLQSQKNGRADRIQNLHYVNRTSGTVEVSTNGDIEGLAFDRIDAPWTELGNRSISGVATTGVYQGNGSDENRPLIAYVTPIDSGTTGQQPRLLVATVRPSSFTEHVQKRPDTRTMVVDGDGRVVFAHRPATLSEYASDQASNAPADRARAGGPSAPGALRAPASTTVANALGVQPGTDVFVGYDQVAGTDWVVLVHTPASRAMGLVDNITEFGLLATLLGVGLVAFVGYYLGKDLTEAIERLAGKAKRLAAGEYDVDLSTNRTDDIGRLYGSFERMAAALSAREQSLGSERDRLGALFENSTDSIVQVDIRGDEPEIVDVNRCFEKRFGYEREDVVGESLIDLIVPAEYAGETGEILHGAKHGDPVEREVLRETVDGERAFRFRFVPIRSEDEIDGEFTEGYAVYTDITERRQTRERLEAANRSLRDLHEVTTDRGDFEATTERLLELGCERFDLDLGILSHVVDGQYEIADVVDPAGTIADGDVFDLGETVCDITLGSDTSNVVTLPDIGATEHRTHPAYQTRIAEAYIGTPVVVDGETYGTVNFSSQSPKDGAFTESECEFIKLLAQWLGVELERRQRERELEVAEALFENTQDLLFVNEVCEDGEFRMERVNPAFETETGFTNADVRGQNLREVFGDDEGRAMRENNRECLRRCEPIKYEEEVSVRDEERFWETRLAPVVIDGEVAQIVGASVDISERKRQEEELERQRHLLERTQQLAHVGGWEFDAASETHRWTDEVYRIHGLPQDYELTHSEWIEFYHPDDRALIEDVVERCITDGEPYDLEIRVILPSGETRWLRTRGQPWYDDDEIIGARGAVQDITDRKRHEEELERQRTLLERTQQLADVGGWELDIRSGHPYDVQLTDELKRIHEVPLDEPFDMAKAIEFYHPEDRPRVSAAVEHVIETGEPYDLEARLITATGGERWIRTNSEPVFADGEVIKLRGALQDITERKERERKLEATTERLDSVVSNIPVILYAIDPDGVFTLSEGKGLAKLGLDPGAVVGESIHDVYPDHAEIRHDIERALDGERPTVTREVDGVVFESTYQPVYDSDGELTEVIGVSFDVTERKDREQELRWQQHLLKQTQQLANVGGWELDIRSGAPYSGMVTDEVNRIHEVPPEAEFDMEDGIGFYHPEDQPRVRAAVEGVIETGEPYDLEARLITARDNERWVRTVGEPVYEDGDLVTVRGAFQDITERKQRELALESLHVATRELLHTESEEDICDVVVDIAEEITDVPGVGLYVLDSEHSEFVPAAFTAGLIDLCDGTPSLPMGDEQSPAWNAFVSGETVPVDATTIPWSGRDGSQETETHTTTRADPAESRTPPADRIRNGLFVPVGDHGVLAALSADEGALDAGTRQLIETLVATAEAAFDRLESEASLRERDVQLQARNSRLGRQVRITDILRSIDQSLIDATSRAEIQTAVCDRLVESEMVSFAWIGERDPTDETIRPNTWAGDGHRYLDTVSLASSDEPAARTAETRTPTVVSSVVDRLRSEPWRKVALEHGFQSVISVPVRHGEYTYGVLTAYAPEPNAFGDLERPVFVELGETVGNTINAVRTKQALYADSVTELKLRFTGEESLLLKLATEADCRVAFDGVSTDGGDETQLFFSATGADPEAVTAILGRLVVATDPRVISTNEDGARFEATISDGLLAATLVSQGVSTRSMVAENGTLDVVIDVSRQTDIRELVQLLEDRYQSAELVARRNVERSLGTKADLVESLLEELTQRQREILMTAYYSGFFECPRETTGQEIATMLDVSQPTVNRHLRLAQQSLLDQLFDTEYETPVATA